MANTSAVYARIDTNLKDNAESILSQLGISPSSAIQMFYSQIVLKKGMLFETIAEDLYTATQNVVPKPGENKVWDRKYRR